MERWSRKQWRDYLETNPASAEVESFLDRAVRTLDQAGVRPEEIFGGPLDRDRALRTLEPHDPDAPDEPRAIRKLRVALLCRLLLTVPDHLEERTYRALVRNVAEVLQLGDRDWAERLRRTVRHLTEPRPEPHPVTAPAERRPESMALIRWEIGVTSSSRVRVTLHDGSGRLIQSLFDGELAPGMHDCEAAVTGETIQEIGPLGYLRMELPDGRWQQSVFIPAD